MDALAGGTRSGREQESRHQLTFATLLAFFRDAGRFPRSDAEIDPEMIDALVHQVRVAR
jgi:hypothetical protein